MLLCYRLRMTFFLLLPIYRLAATDPSWEDFSPPIIKLYIQDMASAGLHAYGFHPGGTDDSNLLSIDLRSSYCPNITQARAMLVKCMEKLLYRLNSSPQARRYVPNGHFTSSNVRLSIDFRSPSGGRYAGNFVTYVIHAERGVVYYTYDPDPNNINHLKVVLREPYHYADQLARNRLPS